MELTLNKIPMEGYACPLDAVVYQEETQESIVPDASPDILRIISTQARVGLGRKESLDGKGEVSGTLRVTVLYCPEGEEGPRMLEVEAPFRCVVSAPGLTAGCPMTVIPRVTGAETRVLNPRKVLVRVELAVRFLGWTAAEEDLCEPWEEPEYAIQQRVEEAERYAVMATVEKHFSFADEVALSSGQPEAAALLGHRLDLCCDEAKVIGNKLIFKGKAVLRVRYRTAEGALACGRWELPFSQIVEVDGAEEESACRVAVLERESEVTLTAEGGHTLSVRLELLAQAVIRQTRSVRVFADAYSVTHSVTVERKPLTLTQLWEESSGQEMIRAEGETPGPVSRVEDCWVLLGEPQAEREDKEWVVTVSGQAHVLYTGEDGQLTCAILPVSARRRVALPEGGNCRASCSVEGDVQAAPCGGGVEVRVPVTFRYRTTADMTCWAVAAVAVEEREPEGERPSVILRRAQAGECLWDIAKAYSATQADIRAVNELEEGEELTGKMLLIPRSR